MMYLRLIMASIITVFFTGQVTVAQVAPAVVTVPSTTPMSVPPPAVPPPSPPTSPGTTAPRWCVAVAVTVGGVTQEQLQAALDYACGNGAECGPIQPGGLCFNPNSLERHASFAFNSYYQKNPQPTSCSFNGTAKITTTNPSYNSCTYPSSSSSSSTTSPTTPPTTTTTQYPPPPPYLSGMVTPPSIWNSSYAPVGSIVGSPFTDSSSASMFTGFRKPLVGCIVLLVGVAVLDI